MIVKIVNHLFLFIVLVSISSVTGLNPIEIRGYKFFDSVTGDEFVIRGIDYYPRPNYGDLNQNSMDLFTNEHRKSWQRDIPFLQELGVNAIRLYAVDPDSDHDAFMCAMEAAGIYVVVALAHDCPTCAITRDQAPDCYPTELKLQGQRVINAFTKYPNTLAFSVGNEVNHFAPPGNPQWNAPCQKKFLRDMREYVATCHTHHETFRSIPIGLISADNDREMVAMYYNCQENNNDKYQPADWYGLNSYVFCDGKAKNYSDALGLQLLANSFSSLNYSIPAVLTEFGCLSETFPEQDNYPAQRNFLQAKWMLEEPSLRSPFSGGFAFEYSIEMENAKSGSPYPFTRFGLQNYGLGWFSPEFCNDIDTPCEYNPFPAFYNLKKAFAEARVVYTNKDDFVIQSTRQGRNQCPDQFPRLDSFEWKVDNTEGLKCPAPSTYTCRAASPAHHPAFKQRGKVSFTLLSSLVALSLIAYVILLLLLRRQNKKNNITNVATFLTFFKRSDSESDVQSIESGGLLSMKNYADDGKGSDYQAISPGSSTNDFDKY